MANSLTWTGERYLPWMGGAEIHYEHLHRYCYASIFSPGRKVLDIACGEGYGSSILSRNAASVIGIDKDFDAIFHANRKYGKENTRFVVGTLEHIPLKKESVDIITCFESIEHISNHELLLREIKRILSPGGIFIVSTPDKKNTVNDQRDENPFHVKELFFDEFVDILKSFFQYTSVLGQAICPISRLFPIGLKNSRTVENYYVYREEDGFCIDNDDRSAPDYYVAIACDAFSAIKDAPINSNMVDQSNVLINELKEAIRFFKDQFFMKEAHIEKLNIEISELQKRNAFLLNNQKKL